MDFGAELRKRYDRKKREIEKMEADTREAKVYLRAIEDMLKLAEDEPNGTDTNLRAGSDLARTEEILTNSGKPLHVNEILQQLGKGNDRKTKESLTGSLASYARKGIVFKNFAPNIFGLAGMHGMYGKTPEATYPHQEEPPDDFGTGSSSERDTGITDEDVPF